MKFILVVCVMLCTSATAKDSIDAPSCPVCHGSYLGGNAMLEAPNLTVLPDWYIRQALTSFRQNWRSYHATQSSVMDMHDQAVALSEQDIEQAMAFIAEQPKHISQPTVQGDIEHGKALFMSCAVCHNADGMGNRQLNAPPLAGQSDWYLFNQLSDFLANQRGSHPQDANGQMMRAAVSVLTSEQDSRDVIAYINTLNKQ